MYIRFIVIETCRSTNRNSTTKENIGRKNTEKIITDNRNVTSVIVKLKSSNKAKKSIRGDVGGFGRKYAG